MILHCLKHVLPDTCWHRSNFPHVMLSLRVLTVRNIHDDAWWQSKTSMGKYRPQPQNETGLKHSTWMAGIPASGVARPLTSAQASWTLHAFKAGRSMRSERGNVTATAQLGKTAIVDL